MIAVEPCAVACTRAAVASAPFTCKPAPACAPGAAAALRFTVAAPAQVCVPSPINTQSGVPLTGQPKTTFTHSTLVPLECDAPAGPQLPRDRIDSVVDVVTL